MRACAPGARRKVADAVQRMPSACGNLRGVLCPVCGCRCVSSRCPHRRVHCRAHRTDNQPQRSRHAEAAAARLLPLPPLPLLAVPDAAREHVVGWYSSGPRLREADLSIHNLMANYVANPVLVICEVEVSGAAPTRQHTWWCFQQSRRALSMAAAASKQAGVAVRCQRCCSREQPAAPR